MADLTPNLGLDLTALGGDSDRANAAIRAALLALEARTADTGWHTLTIPTGPGSELTGTGTITIRRIGNTVYLRLASVDLTANAAAGSYITPARFIPYGYRAWAHERSLQNIGVTITSTGQQLGVWQGHRLRVGLGVNYANAALQGTISWVTDDPWPTT